MKLIKATKLTGAKRLHRKYEVENMEDFTPTIECEKDKNIFEFDIKLEDEFLKDIERFSVVQKDRLSKELRKVNIPNVSDATHEQGTKEWLQARSGIITASDTPFNQYGLKIPTFDAYVDAKVADAYMVENGITKEDNYNSNVMSLGLELEPLAIEKYEDMTGFKVSQKGLVVSKDNKIGASPDGVTTDDDFNKINIEIKSVMLKHYIAQLDREEQTKKYKAQMQVQMYIMDIDVTHFIVQCQEDTTLPIILKEVYRDEEYISNMIGTLKEFESAFHERYGNLTKLKN